eukprot:TRINITY_DN6392_c3_g1_i1.p1 TRINITY_DN6392_c3_g1~~TRINITY_DN6392_c3_g1_i1.p1  ORF type:complete len:456 (-),score=125.54 TRINITY_DN6392_c3_g1_i1:169-1464(-)
MATRKSGDVFPANTAFRVTGAGTDGIDEMSKRMDESTVAWGLQRIQVGAGKFTRKKMIVIICNGEKTSPLERGRLKALTNAATALFGAAHVTVEVTSREELNVDSILEQVLPLLVADAGDFDVSRLREEYARSLLETRVKHKMSRMKHKLRTFLMFQRMARKEPEEPESTQPEVEEEEEVEEEAPPIRRVKTNASTEDALREVCLVRGRFNWAVLEPVTLELHNAGCGGVEEMKDWLELDKVMFAIIRFTFEGGYKHVFVHWIGPKVSTVKCGQWNSKVPQAEEIIRSAMTINLKLTAHELEELDSGEIVSELQRLTYNLGDDFGDVVTKNRAAMVAEYCKDVEDDVKIVRQKSVDIRAAAAADEASAPETAHEVAAEADPEKEVPEAEAGAQAEAKDEEEEEEELPGLVEALSAVRQTGGEWNWVMIQAA